MRIDNGELDVANSSDVRYVGKELQSYRVNKIFIAMVHGATAMVPIAGNAQNNRLELIDEAFDKSCAP
jgi:hypothetical protein